MECRNKSEEERLKQGHRYCPESAEKPINFIEKWLCLEDGRPFLLMDYHKEIIRNWYGWLKPDGTRSTKLGLLTCGRKNAKSALTFGLVAFHLIGEAQQGGSAISVAVNREQAAQLYQWFKNSIDRNFKLKSALHTIDHKKQVYYPKRNSYYRSCASVGSGNLGHGHNLVIHDEMAFSKQEVFLALKGSGAARPNSLQIITSTAGWDKNGVFYKLVEYGKKVMSGEIIDTTFSPFIYETPADANLDDPKTWYLANPGLGITQKVEDFAQAWAREKQDPTLRLSFIRLHFNQWTDSEAGWITPDSWDRCKGDAEIKEGSEIYVGLDVGSTKDLTAISVIAPQTDLTYKVKSYGFVPEGYLKTRDNVNVIQYETFKNQGCLQITKGPQTDINYICRFFDQLLAKFKIKAVVFDKTNALSFSNYLQYKNVPVFYFPQTHSQYNSGCIEFERLVNSRRIIHDGSALLRWQIGHTFLDRNSKGHVKPDTIRDENKNDNLVSIIMALSHALATEHKPPTEPTKIEFW